MNRVVPVLVSGILGCVLQQPPPQPEEPFIFNTLGSSVHDTPEHAGREVVPERPAAAPPELRALAQAIDGLRQGPAPTPDELARAIHALGDGLVLIDPAVRDEIAAIHALAERVADAPRQSRRQTDLVRAALDRTRMVLARSSPRERWRMREYTASLTRFTGHVTEIDPDRPLVDQRWRIEAAFAAALATIEVAIGVAAR